MEEQGKGNHNQNTSCEKKSIFNERKMKEKTEIIQVPKCHLTHILS